MKKMYDWIRTHKIVTAIICFLALILQALAVHAIHKCYLGDPWFTATWNPGDVLSYVAGFEAFLGTVFLGMVSLEQSRKAEETNKRLSEENNYLQKVMSQKLLPVVKISKSESGPSENAIRPREFPTAHSFFRRESFSRSSVQEFIVNIDVDDAGNEAPIYKKKLSLSLENVSDAMLRHFCIDGITIAGYRDRFSTISCTNLRPGDGISGLLGTKDQFRIDITFYYSNEEIKTAWELYSGGLGATLFSSNTTITGIQFHEFMSITINDHGYSHISYGEKPFEGGENNA